ncbi:MAG TPA: serine/threonine-protein kinase [Kofleriaceae bacterium]|jgi:serine/threonine-protein kinase|nr:serine/threonine-protein kinase [Kofleriaceae bacterium]
MIKHSFILDEPADDRDQDSSPEITIVASQADDEPAGDYQPLVGEQFGKYLLVGELATGGMAEIFLAVRKGLEGVLKVVALKRVLPHLSSSPEFTQMFIDEARLAARLDHPNIVRTYEFDEYAGRYFTVMEYLAGEDLGKVLHRIAASRQHMPIELATSIVSQVCRGLHFAHELTDARGRPLGLVHRDVTPSNIIVTFAGEVKLIDFGVAKINLNGGRTIAGTIKGKVAYMSPEQSRSRSIDRRSDVFSAGVVLWELLTGRPLFARETEAQALYAIIYDPIPRVRKLRPEVPAALEAIALRALSRSPEDRFQTAEEMQLALDHVITTLSSVVARPGGTPSVPRDTNPRALAQVMEQLFGTTRTNAKRSIAQTRSLIKNISLVMKLRTDVRTELIGGAAQAPGPRPDYQSDAGRATPWQINRAIGLAGLAIVLGAGGGITYLLTRHTGIEEPAKPPLASASLSIASTPPGAAIFIAGEPTGMTAPATLTNIAAGQVAVRLELPGYHPTETTVAIAPGARVSQQIELTPLPAEGRLVLANLPAGSIVIVDGDRHPAGEVIPVASGRHEVRLVAKGQTVAQAIIESTTGDQIWELRNHQLVPRK